MSENKKKENPKDSTKKLLALINELTCKIQNQYTEICFDSTH